MGRLLAILVLLAFCVGCRGPKIESGGIVVYERFWTQTTDHLTSRAAFDLDCDTGLRFTLIAREGKSPTIVGVRGCDQVGTYIREFEGPVGGFSGKRNLGPWYFRRAEK